MPNLTIFKNLLICISLSCVATLSTAGPKVAEKSTTPLLSPVCDSSFKTIDSSIKKIMWLTATVKRPNDASLASKDLDLEWNIVNYNHRILLDQKCPQALIGVNTIVDKYRNKSAQCKSTSAFSKEEEQLCDYSKW